MQTFSEIQLLWHTTRYLRPSQIAARVYLRGQAAARRIAPRAAQRRYALLAAKADLRPPQVLWSSSGRRPLADRFVTASDADRSRKVAQEALVGSFTFIGHSTQLGLPIAWDAPTQSQLWRYHLHYSAYLLDLLAARTDGWPDVQWLMHEWISACKLGETQDPWHPFVVSERLVNWCFAIHLGAPSVEAVSDDVWRSLAIQTTFVHSNLETDVGGNHLLKNLKAMAVASCIWTGSTAQDWRERYVTAFDEHLAAQLLSDGAHYERSPMYHLLVLADAIEVILALRLSGFQIPSSLADSVKAMTHYLPTITHPDGDIALFNDSVLQEAPPPQRLKRAASLAIDDDWQGPLSIRHALLATAVQQPPQFRNSTVKRSATEDGGLVQISVHNGRGAMLVDVGRACPDDLPAHAHADLFSFEVSFEGKRLIVDAGVAEYAAGPWRDYYRSTRAHNTLAVDGEDQIECWASFRVARRAQILRRRTVKSKQLIGVEAWHDGYSRLAEPVHIGRTVVAVGDIAWLVLDAIEGTGTHTWESYLHFAPHLDVTVTDTNRARVHDNDKDQLAIVWFGVDAARAEHAQREPIQGWYAPEFGHHVPIQVLALCGAGRVPRRMGYLIAPGYDVSEISVEKAGDILDIRLGDVRYCLRQSDANLDLVFDGAA